jgi:hypothetical protein
MTPRELSERVRACDDPTLHTISKLTRGLARNLVGENASFADFEAMTLAISRESDRLTLQDQLQEIEGTFGDAVSINRQTYVRHELRIPAHLGTQSALTWARVRSTWARSERSDEV